MGRRIVAGESQTNKQQPAPRHCIRCGVEYRSDDVRRVLCGRGCRKGYSHTGRNTGRDRERDRERVRGNGYVRAWGREFLAWDGEGEGQKLTLLANSRGDTIHSRQIGLGTNACLDFLLKTPKYYNNVWFAFGYDVNMMLRDLTWRQLADLSRDGYVTWNGYKIRYIPRKIFGVTDGTRSYTAYDAWGFFQSSFMHALEDWGLKIPDVIYAGKKARQDFTKWRLQEITQYNAKECELLVILMDKLRKAIGDAGWRVTSWHGAGALSGWFLRTIKAHEYLRPLPKPMEDAAHRAYFGGRIDAAGWGVVGDAYHYDITSAYPHAMTQLPRLDSLNWKTTKRPQSPHALCHIEWETPITDLWNPFPYREKDGSTVYPAKGEGWYWHREIAAAQEASERYLKVKIIEAFEPVGTIETPLAEPIREAFKHRAALKKEGNPAHVPIKLGLNSLYGKMAQRASFGRRPRFYSIAWAGMVTAMTRATISDALVRGNTYTTMTDSITFSNPLPKDMIRPYELGGWGGGKVANFACVEAGIAEFGDEIFTRGFELEAFGMTVADMIARFEQGEAKIPFTVKRFVGMKLALQSRKFARSWRRFIEMPRDVHSPHWSGTSKRWPNAFAEKIVSGEWHPLVPRSTKEQVCSYPYVPGVVPLDPVRDEDRAALESTELEGE